MARDTGKALDNALDWANLMKEKIDLALLQCDLYREGSLTAGEMKILAELEAILKKKDEEKA